MICDSENLTLCGTLIGVGATPCGDKMCSQRLTMAPILGVCLGSSDGGFGKSRIRARLHGPNLHSAVIYNTVRGSLDKWVTLVCIG